MPLSPHFKLKTHEAASLLDGVVSANLSQLQRRFGAAPERMSGEDLARMMPILTGIQRGTVRYRRADPDEHWQTWRELNEQLDEFGRASGDCEDLSSAVVAELIFSGADPKARTYVYKSGPKLYHVVVETSRWGLLDPSRAAGMEGNG